MAGVIFSGSAPRSLEGKLFILEKQADASLEGISYILGQTDDQGRKCHFLWRAWLAPL